MSLLLSLPTSPTYDVDASFDFKTRTILPSKLPTPRPLPTRIPPIAHDGKSDLDPTEWKPAEGGSVKGKPGGGGKAYAWRPKISHRPSSEAYSYLSKFHRSAPAAARRAAIHSGNTPSLSHTPTTAASSDGSMAGTPTESSIESPIPSGGTTFTKSAGIKGVELINPKLASIGSTAQHETLKSDAMENTIVSDISYDKKWILESKASAAGSLKKLLEYGGAENTAFAM